VSSGKTIPVVLEATRVSAIWFGVAAIALAAAGIDPALAGKKKQKPEKAPDESIVNVDTKEPMIVVVSIGQQKVDVYRGTTLVTTSACRRERQPTRRSSAPSRLCRRRGGTTRTSTATRRCRG
jgi:hypothetical protein